MLCARNAVVQQQKKKKKTANAVQRTRHHIRYEVHVQGTIQPRGAEMASDAMRCFAAS